MQQRYLLAAEGTCTCCHTNCVEQSAPWNPRQPTHFIGKYFRL